MVTVFMAVITNASLVASALGVCEDSVRTDVVHLEGNTGQASSRTTIQLMCQPQEAVQP